ncbi:MAG: flagellar filament capping protein FliD [Deltaproteobacteria bacterium]|nr:flagellar filament capping protein FliD [Deltaproteobacteria bacterium]
MAGSITTLGLGSGIDLQDMLEQLREIDQETVTRKENQVTGLNDKLTEISTVSNKLFSLKSAALALSLESNYLTRTVASSNEAVATASVLSGTTVRSASLDVTQLATSSSWLAGAGADSATEAIYGEPIGQISTNSDITNANTTPVLTTGQAFTVTYGDNDPFPSTAITINDGDIAAFDADTSGALSLDELAAAINGDAANVEDVANLGASLTGRLVTATVASDDDGNYYLEITSDYVGASGGNHRVAVTTNDSVLDFTGSTKELTFQLGGTQATDNALGLGKSFSITYDNSGSPVTMTIDAADFAAADTDVSGYLSFEELAEAINTDTENLAGSGSGHGAYVWATVETDVASGNSYLRVVSDNGGAGRDEKVTISASDASLGIVSDSITSQIVSSLGNTFTVELNSATTLSGLSSAINDATDNLGVTATVIDDGSLTGSFYLSLVADGVGEENRLIFPAGQSYLDLLPMVEKQGNNTSLNAKFLLDGINFQRQGNTFSDVLTGVSLTLEGEGKSTITVGSNNDQIKEMIKSMVTAYNEAVQEVKSNSSYDPDTEEFGILADTSLRSLSTVLRSLMTTTIKGSNDYISYDYDPVAKELIKTDTNIYTLFGLGMEFERDGTISLNEETLDAVMSERAEEVEAFFLGDPDGGITGFADVVNDMMRTMTGSEGQLVGEENSVQDRIDALELKIEAENARLDKKYELLAKQFIELDRYMNQMTNLSSYLSTQFDSIANAWGGGSSK